jgi:hypothetical protein
MCRRPLAAGFFRKAFPACLSAAKAGVVVVGRIRAPGVSIMPA